VIKLSANLSKKVPIPAREFSSQSYGAGMEIEVSDGADAQEITQRLQNIHGLLEKSIDDQMARAGAGKTAALQPPKRPFLDEGIGSPPPSNGDGNGSSRPGNGRASPRQVKAVFAISKDKGMDSNDLVELLRAEYAVDRPEDLSVQHASDLISRLPKLEALRQ